MIDKIKEFFKSLNFNYILMQNNCNTKNGTDGFNILKLEIYGRILFYIFSLGLIYNYVFFNIYLNFNIFDFIQTSDLLFCWINSKNLLMAIFSFLIIYLFGLFYDRINKFAYITLLIFSFICFCMTFYFKLDNDFLGIIFCSVFFISLVQLVKPIKENPKPTLIEVMVIGSIFLSTAISAFYEGYKSSNVATMQKVNITYRTTYDNKKLNCELVYIGRTSSVTIFRKTGKTFSDIVDKSNETCKLNSFVISNNEDISYIEFL